MTADQDLNVFKFDLDLGGLPTAFVDGYEVVAVFETNFDNDKKFYTDSNGLEMQERILNHRSYYDFSDWTNPSRPENNQNISANYYPVNSAMAIRDTKSSAQMTVNVDKSVGGSSLYRDRMEFMHNRRTPCDDNKGVGEFLNETDAYGKGLRVDGSYYVQLSDKPSQ